MHVWQSSDYQRWKGSPSNISTNMLDYNIIIRKLKLQSCYCVLFQTRTLEKGINFLIPLSYGLDSVFLLKE